MGKVRTQPRSAHGPATFFSDSRTDRFLARLTARVRSYRARAPLVLPLRAKDNVSDSLTRLQAALGDRYAIEREIGEGGMAIVYLADDLRHHRKVALKVLKPELAATLGTDRFLQEVRVTANL